MKAICYFIDELKRNSTNLINRLEEFKEKKEEAQKENQQVAIRLRFKREIVQVSSNHYFLSEGGNDLLFLVEQEEENVTLFSIKTGNFVECMVPDFCGKYKQIGNLSNDMNDRSAVEKFRWEYKKNKELLQKVTAVRTEIATLEENTKIMKAGLY
jgi:hypothetical protein